MNISRSALCFVSILMAAALIGCAGARTEPVYGVYGQTPDADHTITLHAIGKGVPPDNASSDGQAYILAERAAIVDAYRNLSETIHGVYLENYQRVGNMAIDLDRIHTATKAWLRGAEVESISHGKDEVVEAVVRVKIYLPPKSSLSADNSAPAY
jgi:hypothetical protein